MASRQFRSDDTDQWNWGFGNGSDGVLTISGNTTEAPIDSSCSGTSGQFTLSATNASFAVGQLILIHQTRGTGAGTWELNKIADYTAGTITLVHALTNNYTDSGASQAQVRVMKQYSSVTVNNGVTYTAKAWNENVGGILAFFCNGTTTITGTISAIGNNASGGTRGAGIGFNGASVPGSSPGNCGEGTGGTSAQQTTANGNGGGGGANDSGGGGGGHSAAGSNGENVGGGPGTGGSLVGDDGLVSMNFGGGAGSGWEATAGAGGAGGGIVLIISRIITVTGGITAKGGNGSNGTSRGAGGGGAGGSLLFKGQNVTLGTGITVANAGTQGTSVGGDGGAGANGRIHVDYKDSVSGSTDPVLNSTQDNTLVDRSQGGTITASEI